VRRLPRARARWALDSGGFTELGLHGGYATSVREYARAVQRYQSEIGELAFASIQDWMCEPAMLQRTGESVAAHQWRTITSYCELMSAAPSVPWLPVLQGWAWGDHMEHLEMYARLGIDLRKAPLVGVGSVCRRQHATRVALLLSWLASDGLRLHAFGVKKQGLRAAASSLASADSMAWSYHERREKSGDANSLSAALAWRAELVASI
jgi:hypothetical protein